MRTRPRRITRCHIFLVFQDWQKSANENIMLKKWFFFTWSRTSASAVKNETSCSIRPLGEYWVVSMRFLHEWEWEWLDARRQLTLTFEKNIYEYTKRYVATTYDRRGMLCSTSFFSRLAESRRETKTTCRSLWLEMTSTASVYEHIRASLFEQRCRAMWLEDRWMFCLHSTFASVSNVSCR